MRDTFLPLKNEIQTRTLSRGFGHETWTPASSEITLRVKRFAVVRLPRSSQVFSFNLAFARLKSGQLNHS